MKNGIIVIVMFLLVGFIFFGKNDNVSAEENITQTIPEVQYVTINETLKYDTMTYIVYINDAALGKNEVICPYYAPNGKPYLYDVETNTLKEIQ